MAIRSPEIAALPQDGPNTTVDEPNRDNESLEKGPHLDLFAFPFTRPLYADEILGMIVVKYVCLQIGLSTFGALRV